MVDVGGSEPGAEPSREVADLLDRHAKYARWRASPWSYLLVSTVVGVLLGVPLGIGKGPAQGIGVLIVSLVLGIRLYLVSLGSRR